MKFSFVFLLLLDIPHLKGQQKIEEYEHILLRLAFPSFYNSHSKSCCKLYPGGCFKLLDSTGYICSFLKGRVTKAERDGWIEFKISNVQFQDGGFYRCIVLGTPAPIYRDYYVEIAEATNHRTSSQPAPTTTIKALKSSTALPTDSTGPVLTHDHSDSPGSLWGFGLPLTVIVSIMMMILITVVIGVVCFRVKARAKSAQADKHGEFQHESLKQDAPEMSGVVYTTVDFRAHQTHAELYANLGMPKTRAGSPHTEHAEMVEYSTLAIHQ
ncbi:hypothetical protein JOB18_021943 [Solea senegalensis]|uniref:Uncharacterized protein n=1 Tax=Solea senegalensis TaxID=28829 RepID=A0AAV6SUA1_SOLSE|nr:triggering receptor expressed on myeloid cells 1 [Solea senegalensis]KAG7520062.1 hypothetical protein JOB18_021943 [Solea senegalensis]